jgi:nucleoside-diphosphate-sugar epimerase|nr:SDR family NAD(P)-dependent oxidoreductase [Neorhizobium tomejilense]
MKAFVTGATGGLGRNLVERLLSRGDEVVATGRNRIAGKALSDLGARFVAADICDVDTVSRAAEGCDTVFHCAALASPWGDYRDFVQANVSGTASVIRAALATRASLVHVSTPSIYFDFTDRLNIDEYDPLPRKFVNHYASTKYDAERLVDQAVDRHGLAAVTLRPRAIFGPHDTALFPRVIAACRNGRLPLAGRGLTLIDVTCVSNLVDAMLLAARKTESLSGRKYNITNGIPILLRDLIEFAFSEMGIPFEPRFIPYPVVATAALAMELWAKIPLAGGEPRLTSYSAGVLKYHQTLSIERARTELGYSPAKGTLAGVSEYARWRRDNEN